MHSRSSRSHKRTALSALLLAALASLAQAADFYKANNETNLDALAAWVNADNSAITTAPANTTTSTDTWIFDNRVILAGDVDGVQSVTVGAGKDLGVRTIQIKDPALPIYFNGNGRTFTATNSGGIDMASATKDLTLQNMFYRVAASGNTINLQVATGRTLTFGSNAQVNVRSNAGGVIVNCNTDGVSTGTIIFGAAFAPSNVIIGAGRVEFNNPAGNTRLGTPTTTVNGGTLVVGNTTGSATGSSPITLNNTATLTGAGIVTGLVTANAGTTLAPGLNGLGTLKVGSLTLATDSKILWEANNPLEADTLQVTAANGLTINGGVVSLYNPGTTDPLTAVGVFDLIKFTGALNGALSNLTLNPATQIADRIYTLGLGANGVTLTIATAAAIERSWDADASGTWSTAANWTADTVPDAVGTITNITGAAGATFSAARTITLDAPRTVGALTLDSAQAVTIDGTSTLTLDNNSAAALLNASGANHLISTPLALKAGGVLADVADTKTLTLGGAVSGTGVGIVKSGTGTLLLTANNTYTGNTSISAGTLQVGAGGTTGAVAGPIASSGVLRFNRSDSVALSSVISGTGEVQFTGAGDTTLSAANTYSGATTLSSGTLIIANSAALQNSTLTYSTTGGSLVVADPVASLTLGGLAGDRALPLANTLSGPLALTVGQNNASTTYTGSPSGSGLSFTKTGSGTLTLGGVHTYTGDAIAVPAVVATTVAAGTLAISTGATFNTAAANLGTASTARLLVNGGTLNASAASLLTNASIGFEVTSGVANFNGGIVTESNQSSAEPFINVTGGILNAASISLSRGALSITSEPASGQVTQGLYVNGGAVNVTGALGIGALTGANSSVSARVDSGSLTVGGAVTVGINNTGRWSVFDINGGTFTSTDSTSGVLLGSPFAGQVMMHVRGSGVAKVQRIQFGQGALAGKSYLNLGGGTLYVGSGGLVLGSSDTTFVAGLRLGAGTLGALADWSSTLPVAMNGSPAIVTGDDDLGAAHVITLQGAATGLGALTKNGAGTVRFTSPSNDYFGPTLVKAGRLGLAGHTSDVITVAAGATLAPEGALSADTGASIEGNLAIAYAASATPPVPSITAAAGGFTLGAASTLTINGTGTLTAPSYVLLKGTAAVTGTFASVTGLPAGYSLNYAYDDDASEATPAVVALVAAPLSPYQAWAAGYPSLTDALTGSDPDGDGLSNFAEYALAQSPVESDASAAYTTGRSGNFLTLAFDHPGNATLRYEIEAKSDLSAASWNVVYTFDPFTTAGAATYTDNVDITATPRRFLRLKVTQTP